MTVAQYRAIDLMFTMFTVLGVPNSISKRSAVICQLTDALSLRSMASNCFKIVQ